MFRRDNVKLACDHGKELRTVDIRHTRVPQLCTTPLTSEIQLPLELSKAVIQFSFVKGKFNF